MSAINPWKIDQFSQEKWEYMSLQDVQNWFPLIHNFTFPTSFLPLSIEDGVALVHEYQTRYLSKNNKTTQDNHLLSVLESRLELAIHKQTGSFVRLSSRSPKDAVLFTNNPLLRAQYASVLAEMRQEAKSYPMPLNDGVSLSESVEDIDGPETNQTKNAEEKAEANLKLRAMMKASGRLLSVKSGKQALELLCASERIFTDLIHTLPPSALEKTSPSTAAAAAAPIVFLPASSSVVVSSSTDTNATTISSLASAANLTSINSIATHTSATANNINDITAVIEQNTPKTEQDAKKEASFVMDVVVRDFNDKVEVEWEFRAFVCGKRMTAISQYWDIVSVPGLAFPLPSAATSTTTTTNTHIEKLCTRINQYYITCVRDLLPEENYIIDFAVLDRGEGEIIVIELNPFGPNTGASLFSWQCDRRLLQGGQDVWGDLLEHEAKTSSSVVVEAGVSSLSVQTGEQSKCEFRWRTFPLSSCILVWESHWSAIEQPLVTTRRTTKLQPRKSAICVLS